jgi:hypothetical protein
MKAELIWGVLRAAPKLVAFQARRRFLILLLLGAGSLSVSRPICAKDQSKTETYDDGNTRFVYSVDSQGRKNGEYRELSPDGRPLVIATYANDQLNGPYHSFFPSGKPKVIGVYSAGKLAGKYREYGESGGLAITATYTAGELNGGRQETLLDGTVRTENWKLGKLHGWRRDAAKDRLAGEQFWYDGRLIIPKGPAFIIHELAAIEMAEAPISGEFPKVPEKLDATLHSASLADENKAGLRSLMAYRFLCDVPYKDLQIDRGYMAHAQAAAEIMERVGKLTHTPENPGMPEDEYQFAYKGTTSSNIFGGGGAASARESVESYMNDSDEKNIDRVGHRRWCLNPAMMKSGFGASGKYSAMWSFDGSRRDVPDFDFIAFPPRGLMPSSYLKSTYAWSLSLNPRKYANPDKGAKIAVTPVQFDPRKATLQAAGEPLEIDYSRIDSQGFGIANCIIFRAKLVSVAAGSVYKVSVSGLRNAKGEPTTVEYFVGFFDLPKN